MTKTVMTIEDVGGSFARFLKDAPREARKRVGTAVLVTADKVGGRMRANAPVGPDAPHIRDTVTFKHRGLTAQVGYLAEDFGGDPAGSPNPATTNAEVALFNEYKPNNQPFMKPAAEAESSEYVRRVKEALASIERGWGPGF